MSNVNDMSKQDQTVLWTLAAALAVFAVSTSVSALVGDHQAYKQCKAVGGTLVQAAGSRDAPTVCIKPTAILQQ